MNMTTTTRVLTGFLCLGVFACVSCARYSAPPNYADRGPSVDAVVQQKDAEKSASTEGAAASASAQAAQAGQLEKPVQATKEAQPEKPVQPDVKEGRIPDLNVNIVQVNKAGTDHDHALCCDKQKEQSNAKEAEADDAKMREAKPEEESGTKASSDTEQQKEEKLTKKEAPQPENVASPYRVYRYMPDSSKPSGTESRLSEISKEISGKVFYELKNEGEKNFSAKVAVVSAVPLSDLKRETEFGRVMEEYLLTDLADRGLKVVELRLGKEINILPQTGEFIMSRNVGELANNTPELDYVIVSTFSNTRKTLIVQGRLVRLKDGLVKTSWRYGLPLNRDLLGLFHTIEPPYKIAVKGMRK